MPTPPPPDPAVPAPKPRRRWLGSLVALLVLAGVGVLAWYLTTQRAPAQPPGGRRGAPATTVGVAAARSVDIPIVVEALGSVTPASTATVRAQVSGTLQRVNYREGQMVRAGELLAEIDPRPFEMALMQAVGQRQRDAAQLAAARVTLERYQTLLQQDSIARQEVDTQAALVQQLDAAVVISRAAEGTARLNLGYTRVVAPIAGRVGLRVVDIGNLVGPGDTGGVAVVTQLAPIDVEFSLPQDRVPELQTRLRDGAALTASALDRTRSNALAEGRFLALDNVIDPQTGTVRAKARFTNDKLTLFPSQFVNLRLLLRTIAGAIVVPAAALRHANDGDYVWVLNERTVAMRRVQRGEATADAVQIVSGLQPGEQVITEGGDRLKEGARVVLPGDRPASGASGATGRASGPHGGASAGRRGNRGASGGAPDGGGPPP